MKVVALVAISFIINSTHALAANRNGSAVEKVAIFFDTADIKNPKVRAAVESLLQEDAAYQELISEMEVASANAVAGVVKVAMSSAGFGYLARVTATSWKFESLVAQGYFPADSDESVRRFAKARTMKHGTIAAAAALAYFVFVSNDGEEIKLSVQEAMEIREKMELRQQEIRSMLKGVELALKTK